MRGASAAGHVIEAFGQFVVGGNYVVGFVLFMALIAIQYLVVAHGAVRTAEVHRALHPRCHARQADGDRRGLECRPDQ